MGNELNGRRIAILVTDGFEQVEMTRPREALQEAGATTDLITPKASEV
jgi:protease I